MSDEIKNKWKFVGRVVDVTPKQTAKGKPMAELVLSQPDGQYERLCVCVRFGTLDALVVGQEVTAWGRVDGRAHKGRYFTNLVLDGVDAHAAESRQPATPPAASTAGAKGLPF